jgi:hypothetical protein
MLQQCTSLIWMMLLFISREWSTIGVESSKDASAATGTKKVGLADWESARLTWALAGATAVGVVGLADWEVGLTGSGQVVISSADFEVGWADFEQAGSPPLLLVGAWSPSMMQ